MPVLHRAQWIPRPVPEVFAFFADAFNLEAITPPYLNFRILTPPPIAMNPGTLIDYRLRLFGIPLAWRTRIEAFVPNEHFVDVQVRGPYRKWHHTHEFYEVRGGTLMVDRVDYQVGWWLAGSLAHALFVRRTLEDIFDFRCREIERLLAPAATPAPAA